MPIGNGLSIQISQPAWASASATETGFESIFDTLDFESAAFGGYKSARMSGKLPPRMLLSWLQSGLGREVRIFSHTLSRCWEGFVDRITVEIGGAQINIGPLTNIINKLAVVYQTVQYNTQPPIGGQRARLTAVSNTDSQDIYGILEGTISGGTGTSTEMALLQTLFLQERAWPETSHTINFGRGAVPAINIECLGFGALLGKYYYLDTSNYGTDDADDLIATVLAADPNSLYSDYSALDTNTLQVPQYADEDKTALSIIQEIVSRGDGSDNRWLFGVYENRTPRYNVAPTAPEYYLYSRDNGQWIERIDGSRVYPWDVQPGKWLYVPDLVPVVPMISEGKPGLRQDLRAVFIESVSYSAPWGLSINGGKVNRVDQKLAKLGLGGTAV